MTFVLGLAATLAAAPASASALWENIEPGMPAAEVRALYPAGQRVRHRTDRTTIRGHALIPECRADVHILHPRGRVEQVVLRGEPAIAARCGAAIFDGLAQRLGRPLSAVTSRPSMLKRIRTTYVWNDGGRFLRFVRYDTDGRGAGLTNASWEMSVALTDAEPEL
jgi:hypothetical protein